MYRTITLAGLTADIGKLRELHQLLTQGRDDRFIKLARRDSCSRNLNGDIWSIHIGHKRYGQQARTHHTQDEQHHRNHRNGDGSV